MSKFQGGMIGSVANTPNGTAYTGRANGVWTLPHHIAAKSALLWAIGQTKPNPPTIGTAIGISGTSVSVAFIPPVVNGGDTITIYTVTSSGSQVGTGAASPIVVSGLTAGTAYTFTVTATNNLGTSVSSSASNSVTPIAGDPYYSAVSMLVNGWGTNNSTAISDLSSTPKSLTVYGQTKLSTTQTKFNTTSLFFDGGGDYLTSPSNANVAFGTNDFTVECWLYQLANNSYTSILEIGDHQASTGVVFLTNNASVASACLYAGGFAGSETIPLNQWYHIAWVRASGVLKIYVNGISTSSVAFTTNLSSAATITIGYSQSGVANAGYYYNGYMDDLRVTKGIARYTANFTPSPFPPSSALMPVSSLSQADPYFSSVSLLLSGDSFTDLSSSPKTITAYDNAQISTVVKKYGTGSMYFDGTGDILTVPATDSLNFGTGDFTIECWFKCIAFNSTILCSTGYYTAGNNGNYNFRITSATQIAFAVYDGQSQVDYTEYTAPSMSLNTWYHIAVVRKAGNFNIYLNGTSIISKTLAASLPDAGVNGLTIGRTNYSGGTQYFNGYIDDFRITKGVARYTTNFTPPVAPLPTASSIAALSIDSAYPAVSLLLTGDTLDVDANRANVSLMLTGDDFIDWSNNHYTITNNSSVTLTTSNKKFNSSAYSFSGSNYLSYLQSGAIPAPISFVTDTTTSGTIECWIYPTSVASDNSNLWYITPIVALGSTYFNFGITNTYKLRYYWYTGGFNVIDSTGTVPLNTWTHVAIVKSGSTVTFYINGVASGSGTNSAIAWASGASGEYLYVGYSAGVVSRYFNGQIADLRITNGIARTITVPTAALPSYRIVDKSTAALAITPYSNVQFTTTQKKYGTTSLYFDGTGDYLAINNSTNFAFGTNDFTIECWLYQTSRATTYQGLFSTTGNSGSSWTDYNGAICIACHSISSDNMFLGYNNGGAVISSGVPFSLNTWTHFAFVRSGTSFILYKDGINSTSLTLPSNFSFTSDGVNVIGKQDIRNNYYFTGYINDLRVTKGVARYTTHFVPPTAALPTTS